LSLLQRPAAWRGRRCEASCAEAHCATIDAIAVLQTKPVHRRRMPMTGRLPMSFTISLRFGRSLLLSGSALASLMAMSETAKSQTALPEVVVGAPSPIVHRAPARPSAPPTAPAAPAEQAPAPAVEATLPGTLPIVTDQFATVTVVPNEEIRRSSGGTLGDLLFSKPGITGSSFAPGASSRPIIRGPDVHPVRTFDHAVRAPRAP